MNIKTNQAGYSLVEVLVAVMILMLAIVGPMTIAAKGIKGASRAKDQTTAFFLAQEGLEMVVKAREDNALKVYTGSGSDVWDDVLELDGSDSDPECTEEDPCGVDIEAGGAIFECSSLPCDLQLHSSGRARYSHQSGGTPTKFRREIVLDVTLQRIHVRSIVTWGSGLDEVVELSEYIYNIYEN